jgi:hypothetical protein
VVAPGDAVTVGEGEDAITGNQTLLVPSEVVSFYDAATAGTQYTDLLDLSNASIITVTTDASGALPQFRGPDGVTVMYADAGGDRRAITAIDLGADIAANGAAVAAVQASVAALAPVASSGSYTDLEDTPTLATVATTGQFSDLSSAPVPGLQYVVKIGSTWPVRASGAPDATRPALWVGPSPAPTAGGSYALAGDLWMATVA